jgi:hypothetical protein
MEQWKGGPKRLTKTGEHILGIIIGCIIGIAAGFLGGM